MNPTIPEHLKLAALPTPIIKLNGLTAKYSTEIYVKRDDQTGVEYSGNKIRKLEFSVAEARRMGATLLITCGGIQSNHCRAVAAVAARLGMNSHLLLRVDETPPVEGNYFLDLLLGARITFCSRKEYSESRTAIMERIAAESGGKAYIIPEGASNGIGNLGYLCAMKEITEQERENGTVFDTVVCAVGSGGTYAGLYLGKKLFCPAKRLIGVNVCDTPEYFKDKIAQIVWETRKYTGVEVLPDKNEMEIIGGYVGAGYAESSPCELEFIRRAAQTDGIIFDPVYTGKAFYGFFTELEAGRLGNVGRVLLIHTGGLYGLFPKQSQFCF